MIKVEDSPKIEVVFWGTSEFSTIILDGLIKFTKNNSYHLKTVITRADKPVGRSQKITESPVSSIALKKGIQILKPIKLDDNFIQANYLQLTADLYVVAAYGKIIPQSILNIPKKGSLNIHPSLLPKYRGASPIQEAILNGDKVTGVSVILMDELVDHGPILIFKKIDILDNDNYQTLSKKLAYTGEELLIEIIPLFIKGLVKPEAQNHFKATFCKLIKKEDGYIKIDKIPSKEKLERMIKAYNPWPGIWTKWRGKIVKLLPEGKLQMEGKKSVMIKDFLNGYPEFPIKDF